MKPAPTLMDEVYRAACRNKPNPGWRDNAKVRHALEKARRFIVDEPMASFMADLANEGFLKAGSSWVGGTSTMGSFANPSLPLRLADSLRVQARLPYEAIWIEYPLRAYQKRANEIRGTIAPEPGEWLREGWLIQQHASIDTACIMHLFTQSDHADQYGWTLWTFPFAFGWCADDNPLPWNKSVDLSLAGNGWPASAVAVGIRNYVRNNVGFVRSPLINDPSLDRHAKAYVNLLKEWTGVVRRVWALLATINDIPKIVTEVRQSKGFLAKGRIMKFLDHSTITLHLPARKDVTVLARSLVATAHRRRHPVRAHWRDDWRHPPAPRCGHLWEVMDEQADRIECALCHGRQSYIHKHERGDATLGWVSHSYNVTHEENGHGKKLDQKGDQEAGAIAPGPGSAGRGEDTLH